MTTLTMKGEQAGKDLITVDGFGARWKKNLSVSKPHWGGVREIVGNR